MFNNIVLKKDTVRLQIYLSYAHTEIIQYNSALVLSQLEVKWKRLKNSSAF